MEDKVIQLIDVHGSHLEIGQQMGEACREKVQHSIEDARVLNPIHLGKVGIDLGGDQNAGAQVPAVCRRTISTVY